MSFISDIFKGGTTGILNGVSNIVKDFRADPTQVDAMSEQLKTLVIEQQNLASEQAEKQFEAQLNDIANARAMQITALTQGDLFAKRFVYWLAMAIVGLAFTFDIILLIVKIPAENHDLIIVVTSVLNSGGIAVVVGYFFGSSKSSSDKNDMLNNVINKKGL